METIRIDYDFGHFIIEKSGQMPPHESDDVRVCATLCITTDKDHYIPAPIRFHGRVIFAGYPLRNTWGTLNLTHNHRFIETYFNARTWKEAFKKAKTACEKECEKLQSAIVERKNALLNA